MNISAVAGAPTVHTCRVCGTKQTDDPFTRRADAVKFGSRAPKPHRGPLEFQPIDTNMPGVTVLRARVPGGWLVVNQECVVERDFGGGMVASCTTLSAPTFVPFDAWP